MAEIYVQPAQTYQLSGTLSLTQSLYADGSRMPQIGGGVIAIAAHATNDGTLGAAPGDAGLGSQGSIAVIGVLTNNQDITLFGGVSPYGAAMSNTGIFHNAGRLALYGGGESNEPALSGAGATFSNSGKTTNPGIVNIGAAAPSTAGISGGALLLDSGELLNSGTIAIAASDGPASPGTLSVSGTMHTSGSILVSAGAGKGGAGAQLGIDGTAFNTGVITVDGGHYASAAYLNHGGTISLGGVLHNAGQIDVYGGDHAGSPQQGGGVFIDAGLLKNTGTILLGGSGAYTNAALTVASTGVLINPGVIEGLGTIVNNGVINAGPQGSTGGVIDTYLINYGSVYVAPDSALALNNRLTFASAQHMGTFDLSSHSTLTVFQGIGFQTIDFLSNKAKLVINDLPAFSGTLDISKTDAKIDVIDQNVILALNTATGIELATGNGKAYDIALSQPSLFNGLTLSSDGHGGTDLEITINGNDAPQTRAAAAFASHGPAVLGGSAAPLAGHPEPFVSPP